MGVPHHFGVNVMPGLLLLHLQAAEVFVHVLHVARGGLHPPVDGPAVGGAMVEVARCGGLLGRGRCPLAGRRARLRYALIVLGRGYCFLGYLLGLQELLCMDMQGLTIMSTLHCSGNCRQAEEAIGLSLSGPIWKLAESRSRLNAMMTCTVRSQSTNHFQQTYGELYFPNFWKVQHTKYGNSANIWLITLYARRCVMEGGGR